MMGGNAENRVLGPGRPSRGVDSSEEAVMGSGNTGLEAQLCVSLEALMKQTLLGVCISLGLCASRVIFTAST